MDHVNQMAAMYGMAAAQLFEELRKNPNSFAAISQQITANKEKQIYNNFVALQVLFNISKPNHGFIKLVDDVIKYYEDYDFFTRFCETFYGFFI